MRVIESRHPATLDSLTSATRDVPGAPGPGEIAVRLRSSSLNYHDYAVVKGMIPAADGRIPLSDGAGDVTAVGTGVTDVAVGDAVVSTFFPEWLDGTPPATAFTRVPGDGIDGYAREAVVTPTTSWTHAPHGYSPAEAATLTCAGLTAWRALFVNDQVRPGSTVLVQGTGGVSIFALQFAKAAGATVIATSSSDAKLERLTAMGADHVINYRTTEAWGAAVQALTGGKGVDTIVEVGGAGTLGQSIMASRIGGHIALIGVLAGFAGPVMTAMIMARQLRVQGLTVGSRQQQLEMIAGINATGIKPVIDKSFDLDALGDAFRYQESGAHFGKIVVAV